MIINYQSQHCSRYVRGVITVSPSGLLASSGCKTHSQDPVMRPLFFYHLINIDRITYTLASPTCPNIMDDEVEMQAFREIRGGRNGTFS